MKTKTGFTLVELIVVITVLSILGTIAFISFQGYTVSARNAIRLDSISKVATYIETRKTNSVSFLAYALTGQEISGSSMGGDDSIIGVNYKAGDLNTTALDIKDTQYVDPTTGDVFKIGVSLTKGSHYEISSILENPDKIVAKVIGTWAPRTNAFLGAVGTAGTNTMTYTNIKNIGSFYIGDEITGTGIPAETTVDEISKDGTTLILSNNLTSGSAAIALGATETIGLIAGYDDSSFIVVDGGTVLPYGN